MKFDRHYFDNSPIVRKTLIRPLEEISNFVTEELPLFTSGSQDVHQAFKQKLSNLDQKITPEKALQFEKLEGEPARVACLDLSILLHSAQHLQEVFPVKLYILLYHLASKLGRLPTFLYEDCVFFNPINDDPRLFTAGLTGATERDFLLIHSHIEKSLEGVIQELLPLLKKEDRLHTNETHLDEVYTRIHHLLEEANSCFLWMGKMSLSEFRVFRDLYGPPPGGKHFGVSGRFSESMNSLRILTEGEKILEVIPNYFDELLENFQYYPSIQRPRMMKLMSQVMYPIQQRESFFCCLAEILNYDHAAGLDLIVARVREYSDKVVNIHYGLTNKYVIRRQ